MKKEVVAELAIIPLGTADTGLSRYIAACLEILRNNEDIQYQLTAMGTVMQGPLSRILEVAQQMHEVPFSMGVSRVFTTLKIDDRRDRPETIERKVEAVLEFEKAKGE